MILARLVAEDVYEFIGFCILILLVGKRAAANATGWLTNYLLFRGSAV
jgi:hypothetical protein